MTVRSGGAQREVVRALVIGVTLGGLAPADSGRAQVFAFGTNVSGRACLGPNPDGTTVATTIDATAFGAASVVQVSASTGDLLGHGAHSLLLADDGRVFSCGVNTNGRTGLGTATGTTEVATPILATLLGDAGVVQVAAGGVHSLLLTDDGRVFAFGSGSSGQTGFGGTDGTAAPAQIAPGGLGELTVEQISAGAQFSLVLAEDGRAFSFGGNADGQTGLGTSSGAALTATAIDATNLGDRRIVQLSAGNSHALVLADDGTVFAFGTNADGRTGLGTAVGSTLVATAIETTNLGSAAVMRVAAGGCHSLLLTEDGVVYAFGSNLSGLTGLGTTIGTTLVATPIDTTHLGALDVVEVAAGNDQSLLLAADGRAFGFGWNGSGGTGQGTTFGETTVATPIDAGNLDGGAVQAIASGRSHAFVVVPEPDGAIAVALGSLAILSRRRRVRGGTRPGAAR